jgi:hypothetical protein
MPLTTPDRLSEFRDGTVVLNATETAGTNKLLLPPGTYKCWVSVPIAPTGTSPTCVATIQEASDGSTWATAVGDAPSLTVNGAATAGAEYSFWFRVSQRANAGVTANVTLILTLGGTTPVFGKVSAGVVGAGAGTGGFNDSP